ncbi:MAG: nucleolar RNA-binding Nop10p family protein [Candidatus Nanoarchaeia archaeon]
MAGIFRCIKCNEFTMQRTHCEKNVGDVRPPKYSPHDKHGSYRRQAKEEERKAEGLL